MPSSVIAVCGVEFRIGTERLGGCLHRLLVARRIGTQGMLHSVTHLGQHAVGNIERVLRHEIDADALGADELHRLLDLLQKTGGRIGKKEMRLVEEEDELRLIDIADFGHQLKQFREKPEQEGRIELRRGHELVGGENVHVAAAVAGGAHQVLDVEGRLAEELVAALLFDHHEAALDGADGRGIHVAIFGADVLAAIGKIGEECAQILQIKDG